MEAKRSTYENLLSYGFLGGDVSKGTCDFVLMNCSGEELESNFQLDDNREGHSELDKLLKGFKKKHRLKKIVVGVESTGGYENNWYQGLRNKSKKMGLEVFRINPKRVYHESKVEGRRSKTDAVSAQVLAGYLRKNYGHKDLAAKRAETDETYANMRTLHKYIQQLTRQNTRIKNILEKLLYKFMPELLAVKSEQYGTWFLTMLNLYPTKKAMLGAGVEGLTDIPYLNKAKATQIIEEMNGSVGSRVDAYTKITISEQAQEIMGLNRKIKRLKKELQNLAEKPLGEDIELIGSIKGLGTDTVIGILIEVEDVGRFEKAASLPAFFGINPTIKQSGDSTFYMGMSKDGSPSARAVLYLAAKNVAIHEPYFKALYAKQRAKGKKHRQVLGIVMSKLSRVIVGMLKSRTRFDPGIDVFNQNKKPENQPTNSSKINKKQRRYQDVGSRAPVSMRQRKIRKQELMSQIE